MNLDGFLKKIQSAKSAYPGPVAIKPGVTAGAIDKWESSHKGLVIPKQYRALLCRGNGLTIRPDPQHSRVGAFTFFGLDDLEDAQSAIRGNELYGEKDVPDDAILLGEADNGEEYIMAESRRERYFTIGAERTFMPITGGFDGVLGQVARTYLSPFQDANGLWSFSPGANKFFRQVNAPSISATTFVGNNLVTAYHNGPASDEIVVNAFAMLGEVARWPAEGRRVIGMTPVGQSVVILLEGQDDLLVVSVAIPIQNTSRPPGVPTVLLQVKEPGPKQVQRGLATLGNQAFFIVYKGKRTELWASDGTPAGTAMLRTFSSIPPTHLMAHGEFLIFFAGER